MINVHSPIAFAVNSLSILVWVVAYIDFTVLVGGPTIHFVEWKVSWPAGSESVTGSRYGDNIDV